VAEKNKPDNAKLIAILSYITLVGWIIAIVLNSQSKTKLGSYHPTLTVSVF